MKAKYNNLYKFLFLIFTMIGYSMTANANENILLLELKDGVVTIEMKPEVAPNHVKRIKELVNDGFYDGIKFHRVIAGFMAQTGDPLGNGRAASILLADAGAKVLVTDKNEIFAKNTVKMIQDRGGEAISVSGDLTKSNQCKKVVDLAIRRYWQYRENSKPIKEKRYNTTLWISLPDEPGKMGDVTTMIGENFVNISSVEMVEKLNGRINFKFNLIIHDLKNFTKLISELKQKEYKFKIIRHKNKKYAFFKKLFSSFKKN